MPWVSARPFGGAPVSYLDGLPKKNLRDLTISAGYCPPESLLIRKGGRSDSQICQPVRPAGRTWLFALLENSGKHPSATPGRGRCRQGCGIRWPLSSRRIIGHQESISRKERVRQ